MQLSSCIHTRWRHLVGGGSGLSSRREYTVKVLYEDLSEDVDGRERPQWRGAVSRPQHVHPEYTGQVGRAHLVDQALLGHLWRKRFSGGQGVRRSGDLGSHLVQKAKEEAGDSQMMLRKRLQHLAAPADPQAALHRCSHTRTRTRTRE